MSFERRPKCKVCGALHFAKDPHQFSGKTESIKLESPRTPVVGGAKVIATLPAGTEVKIFEGKLIAAGPNLAPSIVTSQGLVPIEPVVDKAPKKKGRPATGFDRKAYQREAARKRRAAKPKE